MIEKQEAIRILERFEQEYDEQDSRNYKKHNGSDNHYSEQSLSKMVACCGLRRRFLHSEETDVFEMIRQYKDHYDRLLKADEAIDDNELLNRHRLVREAIDILEKRFRTIERNKLKKKAS